MEFSAAAVLLLASLLSHWDIRLHDRALRTPRLPQLILNPGRMTVTLTARSRSAASVRRGVRGGRVLPWEYAPATDTPGSTSRLTPRPEESAGSPGETGISRLRLIANEQYGF